VRLLVGWTIAELLFLAFIGLLLGHLMAGSV
jgi:hypothetical protein